MTNSSQQFGLIAEEKLNLKALHTRWIRFGNKIRIAIAFQISNQKSEKISTKQEHELHNTDLSLRILGLVNHDFLTALPGSIQRENLSEECNFLTKTAIICVGVSVPFANPASSS